jgi:thiosulfate/3-mercaptopyruvate sulfurtransferase
MPPQSSDILIEPHELQTRLKVPSLRILDTRPSQQYAKVHVPGAVRVDVAAWQELGKTEGGFRNAKAWAEKVGELGIDHDSYTVIYGSNVNDTARVWWMLKYLGAENVAILNGGWDLWAKEKRPTETPAPKIVASQFEPKFQPDRLEEIDTLKQSLPGGKVKIVDARSADEFTGKDVRGKRGGHIPGATHLEWKELLAQDGRFKTRAELSQLFRQRGILPDDVNICY